MPPKELRQRIIKHMESLETDVERQMFLMNILVRISHLDLVQINNLIDEVQEIRELKIV